MNLKCDELQRVLGALLAALEALQPLCGRLEEDAMRSASGHAALLEHDAKMARIYCTLAAAVLVQAVRRAGSDAATEADAILDRIEREGRVVTHSDLEQIEQGLRRWLEGKVETSA